MRPDADPRRAAALVALGGHLALLLAASPANAQIARDPAAAGAAFARGKQAMKRNDLDTACGLFAESVRLDPAPGARLNLAACDEARGHLATARQEFEDALAELPAGDDRIAFARERIARLAPRVPTLALTLPAGVPADVEVMRDGQGIAKATLGEPVPLDPGAHELRVRAAGREDAVVRVSLTPGDHRSLALELGAPVRTTTLVGPPPPDAAPRRLAHAALVGGGASLVAGTVLGILTLGRASTVNEHCTPRCDATGYTAAKEGRWMSVASPVGLALGTALVAAGIYLLVRRPASSPVRVGSW